MKRKAPLRRGGRIKKRSRSSKDFARIYGGMDRCQFVAGLPCVVPRCAARCENAHTGRESGMGFKGPYTEIFPCCNQHHRELHHYGPGWFARQYGVTMAMLYDAAEATEAAWQLHSGDEG